jgi:hypothetical protein
MEVTQPTSSNVAQRKRAKSCSKVVKKGQRRKAGENHVSIHHAKNSVGKKGSWLTKPRSGETDDQGRRTTKKRCKRFRTNRPLSLDTTRTIQKPSHPTICWCRGNVFIELLPSNHAEVDTHTDWCEGFVKYAVGTVSGATIYIQIYINIGSGIQKLMGGVRRQHWDRISPLSFFENKGIKLITQKEGVSVAIH